MCWCLPAAGVLVFGGASSAMCGWHGGILRACALLVNYMYIYTCAFRHFLTTGCSYPMAIVKRCDRRSITFNYFLNNQQKKSLDGPLFPMA